MKKKFILSKNKRVLREITRILKIPEKKTKSANIHKLACLLEQFSYREITKSYNSTIYGVNRKDITKAAIAGDPVGIIELDRINRQKL